MSERVPFALVPPRPADFCCVPVRGGLGLGISLGQWMDGDRFGYYDHAEIFVGRADAAGPHGYTISAYPGGARPRALSCPAEHLPGSLWSSGIIELTQQQRADILAWSWAHVGTPYSFLDYAALTAHMLQLPAPGLREYIASTGHLICSQFVDSGYAAGGKHLFTDGRWPGFVKPGDLSGLLQHLVGPLLSF